MPTLRLYDLEPSPNNIKVRLALGYKGIPFERVAVQGNDRGAVLAATGQPLTPAMEHGHAKLFDSHAILRYLDATFLGTGPRLYSEARETMRAIEGWEHHVQVLQPAIGIVFGEFFAARADPERCRDASDRLHAATERIERTLADADWLVGNAPTAADFVCAPFAYYGCLSEAEAARDRVRQFFRQHLELGPGRERTRAWVGRCLAFDR
jgi:glutathione S-transferase